MSQNNKLSTNLEALLFALGKPLSRAELAKMVSASAQEIEQAIELLAGQGQAENRGIALIDDGRQVELRASPDAADLIEKIRREEFSRELGRAGAEVLAILLYQGPSSRAQIDFIRGVNSTQALRTLAMRGLARKVSLPNSGRGVIYELTTDALGSLGISRVADAPEYEAVREKLEQLRMSI